MYLVIVAVLILVMKLAEFGPVANWSWLWVLLPFALLFFWWEFLSVWIGWDKKKAAQKMVRDEKELQATKKKMRGF